MIFTKCLCSQVRLNPSSIIVQTKSKFTAFIMLSHTGRTTIEEAKTKITKADELEKQWQIDFSWRNLPNVKQEGISVDYMMWLPQYQLIPILEPCDHQVLNGNISMFFCSPSQQEDLESQLQHLLIESQAGLHCRCHSLLNPLVKLRVIENLQATGSN